ncbi:MAG TPA: hypothetical protein VMT10_12475 [Solirubrobacteraceae bacterium]|nr:hypothetical protein [Solirubrobacteraceae bacterium]
MVLGYLCRVDGDPGALPIVGDCIAVSVAGHRIVWRFDIVGGN